MKGAKPDVNFRNRSFERLDGTAGDKYIFEFYPRSKGMLDSTAVAVIVLTPSIVVEPIRVVHAKSKAKAPVMCKCPNPEKCSISENPGRLDKNDGSAGQSSSNSKARRPRKLGPSTKAAREAKESRGEAPVSQEKLATLCGQCKNLKPAPKGKKISWRKRYNTWMVVNVRAEDEEPPLEEEDEEIEEDEEAIDMGKDGDDEHGGNGDGKEPDAEPSDDGYESQELDEVEEPQESQGAQDAPLEPNGGTEENAAPGRSRDTSPLFEPNQDSQTPWLYDASPRPSVEVQDNSGEQSVELLKPNAGGSAENETTNGQSGSSPPTDAAHGGATEKINGTGTTATAEPYDNEAQRETSTVTVLQEPPSQQTTNGTVNPPQSLLQASVNRISTQRPGETPNLPIDSQRPSSEEVIGGKRLAPNDNQDASTKKPRTNVDSTAMGDETSTVKQEEDDGDARQTSLIASIAEKDEEALREELQDIKMKREELRLNQREVLLKRQLRTKLREKGTATVPIKIEEDE